MSCLQDSYQCVFFNKLSKLAYICLLILTTFIQIFCLWTVFFMEWGRGGADWVSNNGWLWVICYYSPKFNFDFSYKKGKDRNLAFLLVTPCKKAVCHLFSPKHFQTMDSTNSKNGKFLFHSQLFKSFHLQIYILISTVKSFPNCLHCSKFWSNAFFFSAYV